MKRLIGLVISGIIALGVFVAILTAIFIKTQSDTTQPVKAAQTVPKAATLSQIDINQLLALTNQDRQEAGVAPLTLDSNLDKSASDKCSDMITQHYYAHTSPSGVKWISFIEKYYPNFQLASENIDAMWYSTSTQNVETTFMDSPEHKANIIDGAFTRIGLAVCSGSYQNRPTVFIVEHFMEPITPAPDTRVPPWIWDNN